MRRLERGDLPARVEPPDERELGPVLASDEAGEAIQLPIVVGGWNGVICHPSGKNVSGTKT